MRMLAFAFALPLLVVVALVLPAAAGAQPVKQVEVTNLPEVQDVSIVGGTVELDLRSLAVNLIDDTRIAGFTTETHFVDVSGHSILRTLVTQASVVERITMSVSFSLENTPDAFVQELDTTINQTEHRFEVDVWGPTARIEVRNNSDTDATSPLSLSVYGVR